MRPHLGLLAAGFAYRQPQTEAIGSIPWVQIAPSVSAETVWPVNSPLSLRRCEKLARQAKPPAPPSLQTFGQQGRWGRRFRLPSRPEANFSHLLTLGVIWTVSGLVFITLWWAAGLWRHGRKPISHPVTWGLSGNRRGAQ